MDKDTLMYILSIDRRRAGAEQEVGELKQKMATMKVWDDFAEELYQRGLKEWLRNNTYAMNCYGYIPEEQRTYTFEDYSEWLDQKLRNRSALTAQQYERLRGELKTMFETELMECRAKHETDKTEQG